MFKKFDVDKAKVKVALQSLEKEPTHENKEAS